MKALHIFQILFLNMGLLLGLPLFAETTTIYSGTSWLASASAPGDLGPCIGDVGDIGPEWTQPGFDDSAWLPAFAPVPGSYYPPDAVSSQLMWAQGYPLQAYFRYPLALGSKPAFANARLWADDNLEFYVNGVLVDHDRSGGAGDYPWGSEFAYRELDIAEYLVAGNNVLAVRGWDGNYCNVVPQGGKALYIEIELEVDCSTTYSMGLNCPPSGDIQSYMDGLFIQLNGGVGSFNPECPPVTRIFFEWGDGDAENTWFPAPHTYADPGMYTITVTAFDDIDAELAQAQCTVTAESDNPLSCLGFNPPMANYPVKAKKNRVFPLKMQLFDADGFEVTGADVAAAPLVEVMFTAAGEQSAVDVTDDLLNVGHGFDGNQFEYTEDGLWQFNLKSTNYSAPGEYAVTAIPGDDGEYSIDPLCVTSFLVE